MSTRYNTEETIGRMNLQLFAETGDGANSNELNEHNTEPADSEQENRSQRTFTQEDVERIINQRIARLKRENETRVAQAREEGRSEAEKLAKMTEEQRIAHERECAEQAARERESALSAREAEITRRELRAEAIDTLTSKGLPKDLEQMLDYSNADACSASIDAIEKVFRSAVQAGVDERLAKSNAAVRRTGTNSESGLIAQMRSAAGLK